MVVVVSVILFFLLRALLLVTPDLAIFSFLNTDWTFRFLKLATTAADAATAAVAVAAAVGFVCSLLNVYIFILFLW